MSVGVGLVGYGYWGPNLARNFAQSPACRLRSICDVASDRRAIASRAHPLALVTDDYTRLLEDPDIRLVAIATAVSSHFDMARMALECGKDVLIEKPIAHDVAKAERLVQLADEKGLILAVDHTFLFTGAVRKIKQVVDSGELGEVLYIDSVRINLGLFQNDVSVLWDLGPHDLSILLHIQDKAPRAVTALGARHSHDHSENLVYLHVEFDSSMVAHYHLSWLAPVKVRQTIVGGSRMMIVYDDMAPSEKVKLYHKSVDIRKEQSRDAKHQVLVDYRMGDMVAPKLEQREALSALVEHVADCVVTRTPPLSDGHFGLKVVKLLDAAQRSLSAAGAKILLS